MAFEQARQLDLPVTIANDVVDLASKPSGRFRPSRLLKK